MLQIWFNWSPILMFHASMLFRRFRTNHRWEQSWFMPMDYKSQRDGVLAHPYRRSKIFASFLEFQKKIFIDIFSENWYSPKFWESVRNVLTLLWFEIIWIATHMAIPSVYSKIHFYEGCILIWLFWKLIFNWLKCNSMHCFILDVYDMMGGHRWITVSEYVPMPCPCCNMLAAMF